MAYDGTGYMDLRDILVINLGGIGDAILSTPALRAIRAVYPGARISVLTGKGPGEIFRKLGYVSEVVVLHRASGPASVGAAIRNMLTLFRLRMRRFDVAVNMRTIYSDAGAFRMRALMGIIAPRISAGRNTDGRGSFLDVRIDETNAAEKYERDYDIEIARMLGARAADTGLDVPIDPEDRAAAGAFLEKAGLSDGYALIGIHVGGKPSRRVPPGCLAGVLRKLSGPPGRAFIFTGDVGERKIAEGIIRESAASGIKAVNACGALPIGAAAELIRRCSVYISGDTANMHIAAALGTALVAVFGPGNLTRFDPRRISDRAKVIYHKVSCAPCENMVCGRMDCMDAVSAEEVAAAAEDMMKGL